MNRHVARNLIHRRCPVHGCSFVGGLSRHHVFPRRWRREWTEEQKRYTRRLCRDCHNRLERVIEEYEIYHGKGELAPLNVMMYLLIYNRFLSGELRWPEGFERRVVPSRPAHAVKVS